MYHLFDVKTTTSMYVINVVFFLFLQRVQDALLKYYEE